MPDEENTMSGDKPTENPQAAEPMKPNEAVKAAADYFAEVVAPINEKTAVALEALEMSKDKKQWLVTLSHKDPLASPVYSLYPGSDTRLYKDFIIDAHTREVISMKNRNLNQ